MPMRTIGMLLGIPEEDQEEIRDRVDRRLRLKDGTMPEAKEQYRMHETRGGFADKRFPTWGVDSANAVQAHTSTVRGWERLPVFTR